MPTEIIAVTCPEGTRVDAYSTNAWVDVMFYHESETPGGLLVSTTRGTLLADNSWSIPRQVPTMPIRLAPGTQIAATSLSGSRTLQMAVSPILGAPDATGIGAGAGAGAGGMRAAEVKAREADSERAMSVGRKQGPVSPLIPRPLKR